LSNGPGVEGGRGGIAGDAAGKDVSSWGEPHETGKQTGKEEESTAAMKKERRSENANLGGGCESLLRGESEDLGRPDKGRKKTNLWT